MNWAKLAVVLLSLGGAVFELAGILVVADRWEGAKLWFRRQPQPVLRAATYDDLGRLHEHLARARQAPVGGIKLLVLGLVLFVAANVVGVLA